MLENQAGSIGPQIDILRLKELVHPQALEIIGKRMKVTGARNAREVGITNTHRGEKTASASWNPGKGLFCDKGDPSYNGDIINFVMRCDDVAFPEAARIVANEAGVDLPYLDGKVSRSPRRTQSNGKGQPHRDPEAQRQGAQEKAGSARDEEESPEQRIERAQKAWEGAGPILDTPGEAYLNTRKSFPAVAKMGAQTLEKLTLPAYIKRVILAGDSDESGRVGVKKAPKAYSKRGLSVAIVTLPGASKQTVPRSDQHHRAGHPGVPERACSG